MVNLAQQIETLRTRRNMSRPALAAALGVPRTTIEKFETGRITPTQAQLEQLAQAMETTVYELKNGSGDMSVWMDDYSDAPAAAPVSRPRPKPAPAAQTGSGSMMDALLISKKFQDAMREAALEALRSPEGQEILANVVRKELVKKGR